METFNWPPRVKSRGSVTFRTLKVQFGDGFSAEAEDGINSRAESWPLEFIGTEAEIRPIKDFLDRHGGWKRFLWQSPMGSLAHYKVVDGKYDLVPIGGPQYTLSVTFEMRPK